MITDKHVPAEPDDFIGRERDIEEIGQLLDAVRLLTLCGPGGIGKTRLALRVAHTSAMASAWFVELAGVSPAGPGEGGAETVESVADGVVRRIAQVVGVAEEPEQDLVEALLATLSGRSGLLVLDTCEHLVEDCAELARRLLAACHRIRILTTSREPLRIPGENVWRVPPLEIPEPGQEAADAEAVRLFAARAGAARPGFVLDEAALPAVADVCRMLDGVPLALELAAARMRVLSVRQLSARLVDRFGLLSAGDRTAPSRQRTLRAAVDWSHDLLGEPERILLRRLSVFAGWTIDPAERVCADALLPAATVLDALTALVDKSLVVVEREVAGQVRFRLLNSIRQYAAERLAEAGEERALRTRHRDWTLERAEATAQTIFGYRPAAWAEKVRLMRSHEADHDNTRAALAWSAEHGDLAEGLRLCTVLRMHGVARGEFTEWIGWTRRFLDLAEDAQVPPDVAGAAAVALGEMGLESRAPELTESAVIQGLELHRMAGAEGRPARGLHLAALAAMRAGRRERAALLLAEAAEAARDDPWTTALIVYSRAVLRSEEGAGREARRLAEKGILLMQALDQQWGVARGHIILGTFARARGDHDSAFDHFTRALPPLREVGALPDLARSLGGLGRAALLLGDPATARTALLESLDLSTTMGLRLGIARGLESLAELHAAEGDARRAVLLCGAAAGLRGALGKGPAHGARLESLLEPIRRSLGEPAVARLWGEGRGLDQDGALALAVGEGRARPPVPTPRDARHDTGGHALPVPRRPGQSSALTRREREIARLVARGLGNRSIAEELVISPATVARHITNILTKLGFSSRSQVAAWAVDNETGET
ncbi:helix-turn-helix transcriptional regulator [Actinocorallia longicatena]|uniref:HTH luxR-type domain-containing protein n=1 Tax=Actinocorallia longicatena TaxID=111803 RepID=A0ABP6QQ38_9ACTN